MLHKKTFSELTTEELYQILRLRNEVFIVEQNCVYQDADNKDQKAFHLFIEESKEIVAYTRIFKSGDYFDNAAISRVVVHPKYRGQQYGQLLMQKSIDFIINHLQENIIEISAQTYLIKFYNELGFKEKGTEYIEDSLPHIRMFYIK